MSVLSEPNEGTAVIVVGIDPHKKSHTAVALSGEGRELGRLQVPATDAGHRRLIAWIEALPGPVRVGLEDVREVSGRLEAALLGAGLVVCRVPPRLMGRARAGGRARGKSDPIDATALARAALAHPDLPRAAPAGPEAELGLLVGHRQDLVGERTRLQARLRGHLHVLAPELQVPGRALERAVWLDRIACALAGIADTRARIASELVEDCRRLTGRIDALERQIALIVARLAPELVRIPGCGALTAARIVAEVADIGRFASPARLARYAGVAPVPASSGAVVRHRLDRAGNRRLNCALYRIAITQSRLHPPAVDYLARKQAEGHSRREAIRCLKRHLATVVHRTMTSARNVRSEPAPTPA